VERGYKKRKRRKFDGVDIVFAELAEGAREFWLREGGREEWKKKWMEEGSN